jgi:hypothetical protein
MARFTRLAVLALLALAVSVPAGLGRMPATAALEPGAVRSLAHTRVLYIEGAAPATAAMTAAYVTLLQEFGATVTVVTKANAGATNLGQFDVIVIATDSAWTAGDAALAGGIAGAGKVVFGIGTGGTQFFTAAGVAAMGTLSSMYTTHQDTRAVSVASPAWTGPNAVPVQAGNIVQLYDRGVGWWLRDVTLPPGPQGPVGYDAVLSNNTNFAGLTWTGGGWFRRWGSDATPAQLTTAGRFALTNFLAWRPLPPGHTHVLRVPLLVREP